MPNSFTTSISIFFGSTAIGSSTTVPVYAFYKDICTNFSHDGSASTFTGNALLSGGFVGYWNNTSTVSVTGAPNVTLSLVTATFTSSNSRGSFLMRRTSVTSGLPIAGVSPSVTQFAVSVDITLFSLIGTTSFSAQGYCYAFSDDTNAGQTQTSSGIFLLMSRIGTCAV